MPGVAKNFIRVNSCNSCQKSLCVFAPLREILRVQKLGKNHGGYHGETIDIRAVLRAVETAAQPHGWTAEIFHARAAEARLEPDLAVESLEADVVLVAIGRRMKFSEMFTRGTF